MNILVTGGAGFIGSNLVKTLLQRGDSIVIIDDMNSYYNPQIKRDRLAGFKDQITFYQFPISDFKQLKKVFQNHQFDKICHLAAQAGVRYSLENPFAYQEANVLGTLNILELMKEFNIKDIVYASSSSVYGNNQKSPFAAEDRTDTPISLYAATKKTTELYAYVYHHLYNFNCFGLRFFTVYGPWGRPDMALFKFTKAILNDEPIDVYNAGKMKRSFSYISDVVEGIILAIDKVRGYDLLNIGNPNTVELTYFIECIEKKLGKTAQKNMMPMQQGDVPVTFADIEHTKQVLGWEPKIDIEQGISKFIDWYIAYNAPKPQPNTKIAVVGLGYVGLPLAIHFAKYFPVIGFDVNEQRITQLEQGIDHSNEITKEELTNSKITFTTNPTTLRTANFIVVCVPTPIDKHKKPDLNSLKSASQIIGGNLSPQTIVVYESTVYPGVTEDICVPILEKASSLTCGSDFKVGYSPERINPGDKERTIRSVTKVVAGQDKSSLEKIDEVYSTITTTHKAPSIKVAEAAKVIENIQRDLNIALMNELSLIFDKMDLDTTAVLEAASTKWNFHNYHPGLVGGHCIGVDPYYLTYKAEELGHHPQVILAGRRINDDMHLFYTQKILKHLQKTGGKNILILGLTFKANVPDYRNSRVKHLIKELQEFNFNLFAYDPFLSPEIIQNEFKAQYKDPASDHSNIDLIVVAVEHDQIKQIIKSGTLSHSNIVTLQNFIGGRS
jgi:UDP-N-acetyl-D-glucosamine/UDP-N-acetyl-D-galactosamine dehydrogenase